MKKPDELTPPEWARKNFPLADDDGDVDHWPTKWSKLIVAVLIIAALGLMAAFK